MPGWKPRGPTWCKENVPSAPTQKDSPEGFVMGGGRGAQSHDSEQPCPLVSWFSSSAAVHPDIPAPLRASFWDLSVFIATTPSSPIPFSEKSGSPASGSPFLGAEGERGCQP